MKRISTSTLVLLAFLASFSQPYSDGRKTRHRFAQLTVGGDIAMYPNLGSTSFLNTDGSLVERTIPTQFTPRMWIGGLHFWGHADFGITIPFGGIKIGKDEGLETFYDPGVETIAKWYPWAVTRDKIRPYLGFSAQPMSYRLQTGDTQDLMGPWTWRITTPLLAGLTWMKGNHLWEAGVSANLFQNDIQYPVSPTRLSTTQLPPIALSFGYKFMLDTTVGAEASWENGNTEKRTTELGTSLNGWFVGVGPSTSWLIGPSAAIAGFPAVKTPAVEGVFVDIVAGYYWHKPDLNLNLAYRSINSTVDAYGLTYEASRRSLGIECTKYFADYHGFAPFIGPIISYENLSASLNSDNPVDESWNGIRAGITAGWDIRPNRLQGFYLRTNLRYFPGLGLDVENGSRISFQQLEVNFIQFVWMLGR